MKIEFKSNVELINKPQKFINHTLTMKEPLHKKNKDKKKLKDLVEACLKTKKAYLEREKK